MADTATSSSLPRWSYDVFLSFRGEDTRRSFVDHLYSALCRVGVNAFRDSEELRKGEDISVELLKAIEQSRISIIVFSETYPSSRWCLEELVKILECKERLKQVVLPVFYHVHPSEVRKQTGGFGDALTQQRQRFTNEKVNEWKAALTKVANFSGCDLQNVADGYESKFIDKIIGEVLLEVNCTYMNVAKHPVGIDIRAKELLSVLQLGTNDEVRMIGIYGMGGIGKTTLAKSVYNQTFQMFEGSCFLANVRSEASEKHVGLTHLQKKLLCKTLRKKKFQVDNVDEGISLIKARLGSKRVLVVLDDVDHISQLESLAGERDWFGSSSRVIITTRDAHLLSDLRTDEKYEMQRLSSNESLQLFSWHAFGCFPPAKGYNVLSEGIVNYAAGLPLALVVLGSHFRGRSKQEWIYDFEKLRQIPHGDVQKILRISYDSLDDDTHNIFLDIACFFIGSDIQDVVPILNGCGFYAESGIQTLVDRSLLTVCKDGELQMHDLIRDMGREVVRMESPRDVGKRSRLFLPDDVSQVLQENKGTEAIEGMIIHSQMLKNVHFSTKLFSRMVKLRILKIDGDLQLKGSFKYLSNDLRLFSWRNCQLRHIPSTFHLQKLVCLDLQGSDIEEFQPRLQHFSCLKILKLDGCGKLKTAPDFTRAQTLQRLSLTYCSNLVEMPESIGDLKSLVELDLSFCSKLRKLPNSICQLKALEKLSMWSCSDIQLPTDLGKLERLRELDVNVNAFSHLSFSCGDLCSLKILRVNNDHGHKVGLPPICFGGLSSVEYVYIISSYCHVLPFNLFHLSNLISLTLIHCTNLRVVQQFPPRLKELFMYGCISLEVLPDLSNLTRLNILDLHGCESLVQLQGLEFLESLQEVDIRNCSALINFPLTDEFFKAHSEGDIIEIFLTLNEFLEWNISLLQGVGCSSSTGLRMPLLFEHEFIGMIFGFFDQGAHSVIINNKTTNVELLEYWAMGGGWKVEDGDIWLIYIPKHHFRGSIEFGDKLEVVADTPEKGSDEERDVLLDTPERNLACECKIQLGIYQDKDGHLFFFRMNRNLETNDISECTTSPRSCKYSLSFSNQGSDLDADYDSIGEMDTYSCAYDSTAEIDTYSCSSYTGDHNISSTPGVSRFDGSLATSSFNSATTGEFLDSPGVVSFDGNLTVSSSSNATPVVFCSVDSFVTSSSSITTPSAFSFGGSSIASLSSNATPSVFSCNGNSIASSPSNVTPRVYNFSGNSFASSSSNDSPNEFTSGGSSASSLYSNAIPTVFSFSGNSITSSAGNSIASSSSNANRSVFSFSGNAFASSSSITIPSVFSFSGSSTASLYNNATRSVFSFSGNAFASSSSIITPSLFSFGGSSTASLYSNAAPSVFSFSGNSIASSPSITIPSVFSGSCIASSCSKATASFSGNSIASSPSIATPIVTSFSAGYVASSSSNAATPNVFSFGGNSIAFSASNATSSDYSFNGNSIASSSCNVTQSVFRFGGCSTASLYRNTATRSVFSFSGNSTTSSSTTTTPTAFSFGGYSIVSSSNNATPGAFSFTANSVASMFSNTTPACVYSFSANSTASSSSRICSVHTDILPISAGAGSTTPPALSSSSPLSTEFTFGAPAPMILVPSPGASRGPGFAFGSASSTSNSRTALGNYVSTIGPRNGNSGSTSMEDSMAKKDAVQSSVTAEASTSCCFPFSHFLSVLFNTCFSSPFESGAGGQHNQSTQQNSSAFQASDNLEIGDGGSFSLGSGGHSKSGLKIATVRRSKKGRK